jgi:hypothetical protein
MPTTNSAPSSPSRSAWTGREPRKFNRLVDTLIKRTKASPVIPAKDKAEAVRLYVSARQTLPVCVPPLHK